MTCPFCEIVAKRAPARKVAWWLNALAIEPLNPVTPGHVLIIPKRHVADALEDPVVTGHVFQCAADYARDEVVGPCNLITSVGSSATQTVFHLHVHVVPRSPEDGLKLPWSEGTN